VAAVTDFDPFAYPVAPHVPRHAPAGYTDYGSYKPWLRDDFAFRCVYCLTRERWDASASGHAGFGVDHVAPRSSAPSLTNDYGNLVYACNSCNSARQAWPPAVNPLTDALTQHLRIDEAGVVHALTVAGQRMIDRLDLNAPNRVAVRLEKRTAHLAKQADPDDPHVDHLFRRAFGYPDDLPDLAALRPPGGNAHFGSEAHSHFARRAQGALSSVY
jgi:hypothetical protein